MDGDRLSVRRSAGSHLAAGPGRAEGGEPRVLLDPDRAKGERYASPEFLPDGRTLLFTRKSPPNSEEDHILVWRPEGGEPHVVYKGGAGAHYVPAGYLLYLRNGVLMAAPFDAQRRRLLAETAHLVEADLL